MGPEFFVIQAPGIFEKVETDKKHCRAIGLSAKIKPDLKDVFFIIIKKQTANDFPAEAILAVCKDNRRIEFYKSERSRRAKGALWISQ